MTARSSGRVVRDGRVAEIALTRPEARNALGVATARKLRRAVVAGATASG